MNLLQLSELLWFLWIDLQFLFTVMMQFLAHVELVFSSVKFCLCSFTIAVQFLAHAHQPMRTPMQNPPDSAIVLSLTFPLHDPIQTITNIAPELVIGNVLLFDIR